MNKQSNTYTVIYIIIMVVVVGTALAFTSLSLKNKQQENANADKMKQILASVHITPAKGEIQADFNRYIVSQMVINSDGEEIEGNAFEIKVTEQIKKPASERLLPIYICKNDDGKTYYILPVYGAGLWGPIWGYISIESNGSTIYGAYFAHQGETPGLGAEIDKPEFGNLFSGKSLFKDEQFRSIAVIKSGQKPLNGEDYVDGISGGTITSKGVETMLANCLYPYESFLKKLSNK